MDTRPENQRNNCTMHTYHLANQIKRKVRYPLKAETHLLTTDLLIAHLNLFNKANACDENALLT